MPPLQNAGKSSLINAMRQAARLPRDKDVTTAPLPGTTLGELGVGWPMCCDRQAKGLWNNREHRHCRHSGGNPCADGPLHVCAGMLRVSGLLPTGCKMLDTPGVPHAHQVGGINPLRRLNESMAPVVLL